LEKELIENQQKIEKAQLQTSDRNQDSLPVYKLATPVPENWIPFIPVNSTPYFNPEYNWDNPVVTIRFRRGRMLLNRDDEEPIPITAKSRLLSLDHEALLWLNEESVTKAGIGVQVTRQMVRGVDGERYVWLGKKVVVGRGEGRSGLKFDVFV
jgi:hypothetical protein